MSVEARFRCTSKRLVIGGSNEVELVEVVLNPVNARDGDNADWSRWTPNGQLAMTVTNMAAADQFVPGTVYRLLLEPVSEA